MIVHDIKTHVLCSQCRRFRYTLGPYQCKRGHLICSRCQPVTEVCPRCFIFVDVKDPIHCHSAVDLLMDKVPVPCVYISNGCVETNERALIREHVLTCRFRKPANIANLIETAEAGTVVSGAGSRSCEDGAETVVGAVMNDQNEETVGGAEGRSSDDDIVLVRDMNDRNEEIDGRAESRGGEDGVETVLGTGQDGETVSGPLRRSSDDDTVLVEDMSDQNEEAEAVTCNSDDDTVDVMNDQNEKTDGGAGACGSEDGAVKAMVADMNDLNAGTVVMRAVDILKEHNYVEILLSDDDEQNEGNVGATAGRAGEDDREKATLPADINNQNEETVGVGSSVDIQNEHNYEEIVLSDDDGHDDGHDEDVGGVVDLVSEDDAVDMDDQNVEKVRGAEGPVAVNTDDNDKMETEEEQNQEAVGVREEGNNVVGEAGDEPNVGMEIDEVNPDAGMEDEENNNGDGMVLIDVPIEDEIVGPFPTLVKRYGIRKRIETKRYSPLAFKAKATRTRAMKAKSKKKKKPYSSTLTSISKYNTGQQYKPSSAKRKKGTHECVPCEKKFCSRSNLLRHNETVHQLRRPYECTFCGDKFWQKPNVTNHLASFHSAPAIEKINETDEMPVALYCCCMFCESRFVKKDELREHISELHNDKFELRPLEVEIGDFV